MIDKIELRRSITRISQDKVRINITLKDGESWKLLDSVTIDVSNNTIYSNAYIHKIGINLCWAGV